MNTATAQNLHDPLPFCPGCGHERLLKELDKALVKLQLDPKDVVIVTDIGCSGRLRPNTFDPTAFMAVGGRIAHL